MFTKKFWIEAAERCVRAGAASALSATVVGDAVLDAFDTDWGNVAGVAAGGAIVSLLVSLAASGRSGTISEASFIHDAT